MSGSEQAEFTWDGLVDRLASSIDRLSSERAIADDFFQFRLRDSLARLVVTFEAAAGEGRLDLDDAHRESVVALDEAFNGSEVEIFRAVHFAQDSDFMSSRLVRTWSEKLDALVAQGRVLEVRRLIVSRRDNSRSGALAQYVFDELTRPGHRLRLVEEQLYRAVLVEARITAPHDFGVYGRSLVFFSSMSDPKNLSGTWLRDFAAVERFSRAFDRCWEAGIEI